MGYMGGVPWAQTRTCMDPRHISILQCIFQPSPHGVNQMPQITPRLVFTRLTNGSMSSPGFRKAVWPANHSSWMAQYFCHGVTQDWVARMVLPHWLGVTQIVYIEKVPHILGMTLLLHSTYTTWNCTVISLFIHLFFESHSPTNRSKL